MAGKYRQWGLQDDALATQASAQLAFAASQATLESPTMCSLRLGRQRSHCIRHNKPQYLQLSGAAVPNYVDARKKTVLRGRSVLCLVVLKAHAASNLHLIYWIDVMPCALMWAGYYRGHKSTVREKSKKQLSRPSPPQ